MNDPIDIAGRTFLTPYFMKSALYCLRLPFFPNFVHPSPCSFCCLISLAQCIIPPHPCYSVYWYYRPKLVESWYLSTVAPCYAFHVTRHQIYWRFDTEDMVFASTQIWYHSHRQTYTQDTQEPTDRHTHINIYQQHPLCEHNNFLYYSEWLTCWYKALIYGGPQCICFSKITHL